METNQKKDLSGLTQEQIVKAYLQSSGVFCPFCGSYRIEVYDTYTTSDEGIACEKVRCYDCERSWTDNYTLTGVDLEDEDEGDEDADS